MMMKRWILACLVAAAAGCSAKKDPTAGSLDGLLADLGAFAGRAYPGGTHDFGDGGVGTCHTSLAVARHGDEIWGRINAAVRDGDRQLKVETVFIHGADGAWTCKDELGRIEVSKVRLKPAPPPCAYLAERCGPRGP